MESDARPPAEVPAWHRKAHRLIAAMCEEARRAANTRRDGTPARRHRPYSVPAVAQELVDCLGREDEEGAKALFLALGEIPEEYQTSQSAH